MKAGCGATRHRTAFFIQRASIAAFPDCRMPRKLITKLHIRAKSGQAFFRASTFAACHSVSRDRGLLNSATATSGEICPETVE